jgi:hypothetical protein
MNISKLTEGEIGFYVTIVTKSGNKVQGNILKNSEIPDLLRIKTKDGLIYLNPDSIESIY